VLATVPAVVAVLDVFQPKNEYPTAFSVGAVILAPNAKVSLLPIPIEFAFQVSV